MTHAERNGGDGHVARGSGDDAIGMLAGEDAAIGLPIDARDGDAGTGLDFARLVQDPNPGNGASAFAANAFEPGVHGVVIRLAALFDGRGDFGGALR